ncbi:MAG: N-acyl homoserine lactonase family protein [Vicinamibacterales bacterium]
MKKLLWAGAMVAIALALVDGRAQRTEGPQAVQGVRLYVLDGGVLESDPTRYRLSPREVRTTQLAITAFLIVHPRGILLWDTGAVPDDSWTPTGQPVARRIVLSDGRERPVTVTQPIAGQIAAAGIQPAQVTHLGLSHAHWDHTANANAFASATWLARQAEREAMLPALPPTVPAPSTFARLRSSTTTIVNGEHDVFGDGTVIMLPTPGHTAGHQALYVKLANTGGVVLTGDLYHYPEERTLNRLPTADADVEQTRRSREWLDDWLMRMNARLWIQHDLTAAREWKKSPAYYD